MRGLSSIISTLLVCVVVIALASNCRAQLKVGFYDGKCGEIDIENVIFEAVKEKLAEEADTVSDLVRLTFHDCFVRGCDGSVFIAGENTEQTAKINQLIGGLDTMDELKAIVEAACPGVVSCADTLVIGARAAISLTGGKWFDVETGRRDGLVSLASEAQAILPLPTISIEDSIELFARKGLNKKDMVYLLGGHTVGTTHCHSFKERLYNFKNTNKPDPSISSSLLKLLRTTCPLNDTTDNEAFLDQTPNSHFTVDNAYYKQILAHNGTMEIDSNLAQNLRTQAIVVGLALSNTKFLDRFNQAMVKMARIDVLTGSQGEIRKTCSSINSKNSNSNMVASI